MSKNASYNYTGFGGNPYRSGVIIGNYVEDNFGDILKSKYSTFTNLTFVPKRRIPNMKISEMVDKFRWPDINSTKNYGPTLQHPGSTGQNLNFNINFNKKTIKECLDFLHNPNPLAQHLKMNSMRVKSNEVVDSNLPESEKNSSESLFLNKTPSSTTFHKKRALSLDHEIRGNLLFGHGCQKKFDNNDLSTFYHLTLDKKIPTRTLLDPHWKVPEPMNKQPNPQPDHSDWGFRNYKIYGRFTKKFDKKKK